MELRTVAGHAELEALLETAVLTAVAVDPVDDAVLVARALVVDGTRLTPPEETLQTEKQTCQTRTSAHVDTRPA